MHEQSQTISMFKYINIAKSLTTLVCHIFLIKRQWWDSRERIYKLITVYKLYWRSAPVTARSIGLKPTTRRF